MTKEEMRANYAPSTKKLDDVSLMLTFSFAVVIGLVVSIGIFFWLGLAAAIVAFFLTIILVAGGLLIYFFSDIQSVPESYVWIIQFLGAFKVVWAAGGHLYFSLFGWLTLRSEVYLGETTIDLYPDSNDLIDLDDTSCHFKAAVVIKVVNPLLATYNIKNYKEAVRERIAGLLRASLSKYTLDQANEEKHELDLGFVISGIRNNPDWKSQNFYLEVYNDWGVDLLKLIVEDLELSPEDIAQRQRKQNNEINRETAKADAEIKRIASTGEADAIRIIADAEKFRLEAEGKGIALQIDNLVKSGMSTEAATKLVNDRYKWSKIGDKALIIDNGGGNSTAGEGAKFGAGMEKGKTI